MGGGTEAGYHGSFRRASDEFEGDRLPECVRAAPTPTDERFAHNHERFALPTWPTAALSATTTERKPIMRSSCLALSAACALCGCASNGSTPSNPNVPAFQLTSPTVHEGQPLPSEQVFNGYGCSGANISPELAWVNPPAGARSFAISLVDKDGQSGKGLQHWLVYDIPSSAVGLPAGIGASSQLPSGAVAAPNDFGMPGFAGACPPVGAAAHHYVFTVHALKTNHVEPPSGDAGSSTAFLAAWEIGRATLTATFAR